MKPQLVAPLACAFLATAAVAQCQTTEASKLSDPDGDSSFDQFGRALDISGDTMILGEPGQNRAQTFTLTNGTWVREDILTQSPDDTLGFGYAVAIDGDFAIVGTPENRSDCNDPDDCTTGAAWIYTRSNGVWTQGTKFLHPFYLDDFNLFGSAVDLFGDTALVSAPGSLGGVVVPYRYDGSQWNRLDPFLASDGDLDDAFGRAIALGNGLAVVGAPNNDDLGQRSGSAYIYRRTGATTWAEEAKLLPNDLVTEDRFGQGVAVLGDLVAVGAAGAGANFPTTIGAVYLFRHTNGTWTQEARLVPANGQLGDAFGYAIAIPEPDIIVATALTDPMGGLRAGAAYVFKQINGVWTEQARLDASDSAADQQYGIDVAAADGIAAVGASEIFNGGGGNVYFYGGISDCNSNQTLDLCDIALGNSADSNNNQQPDECETECVATEFAELLNAQSPDDQAGTDVAIAGDTAVVGVPNAGTHGRVDLYDWNGTNWSFVSSALGEGLTEDARLGTSVAAAGDIVAAGAPRHNNQMGAVAVYRNINGIWNFEATLEQPVPEAIWFGATVETDGNTILVGVRGTGTPDSQIVYVYTYDTNAHDWVLETQLKASNGSNGDSFSASMAINDEIIAVGAPVRTHNGLSSAGTVYIFTKEQSTWQEEAIITAPDAFNGDRFGVAVGLRNGQLFVGAERDDDLGNNSGSAYVFHRQFTGQWEWDFAQKLLAPNGMADDHFGKDIAVTDSIAVIGARHASNRPGAAFVFTEGASWTYAATLLASDGQNGNSFGSALALGGSRAILGAPLHSHGGSSTGAAYIFHGIGDCNNNARLDICDIALGVSQDTNNDGEPDECACPADFNDDGTVNTQDVLAFLNAWNAQDPRADFNMDGAINTLDVLAFLNAWAAGC